eukprot:486539-Lingulodinium_polyedra.AAC.1
MAKPSARSFGAPWATPPFGFPCRGAGSRAFCRAWADTALTARPHVFWAFLPATGLLRRGPFG